MKEILILANSDIFIKSFKMEFMDKLIKSNYRVYLSCPSGEHIEDIENLGVIHIKSQVDRRGSNPFRDYNLYKQYKKIIGKLKPDVVFTMTIKPNIYGGLAARKYKVPYISNITGLGTAFKKGPILRSFVTILYKLALKSAKYVFFENQDNLELFTRNIISREKAVLIPGSGVNLQKFKLLDYPRNDKIVFLFLGRIMREKGIEEYIKAAKILKNKYPNLVFNIVGPFEELKYKEVIMTLQQENIIQYYEQTKDVFLYIQNSNALVQPSYHEGLSNVLLEASASGRPVIASNIPGCREVFIDGTTGFGFDSQSTESLILAIERFLLLTDDERKIMGINGRLKIEKDFNREFVVDKYLEKIKSILGYKN